jgi:hypothetical protein
LLGSLLFLPRSIDQQPAVPQPTPKPGDFNHHPTFSSQTHVLHANHDEDALLVHKEETTATLLAKE